jgi:hypothetical protein
MDRRKFLKILATVSGASTMTVSFATWAQMTGSTSSEPELPHLLLLLRTNGGWDVAMAMDAKDPDGLKAYGCNDFYYLPEREPVRLHQGTYLGQTMRPLFPYLNDIAIVNGLVMLPDNIIHEVNRTYMATGSMEHDKFGFAPFYLSSQNPLITNRVGARLEYEMLRTGTVSDYDSENELRLMRQGSGSINDLFDDVLALRASLSGSKGRAARSALEHAKEVRKLKGQDVVRASITQFRNPDDQYLEIVMDILTGMAVGRLGMGVCDFVADQDLDTHFNHKANHTRNLTAGMDRLAKIITAMKEVVYLGPGSRSESPVSLFDITTVVVMSEFSRTAARQRGIDDGTDHNPLNNSCLLFGKNIQGSTVIGRSHVYKPGTLVSPNSSGQPLMESALVGLPYDAKRNRSLQPEETRQAFVNGHIDLSNNPTPSTGYLGPGAIWRTVAELMDLKADAFAPGVVLNRVIKKG